jgi:hypothetical protein
MGLQHPTGNLTAQYFSPVEKLDNGLSGLGGWRSRPDPSTGIANYFSRVDKCEDRVFGVARRTALAKYFSRVDRCENQPVDRNKGTDANLPS